MGQGSQRMPTRKADLPPWTPMVVFLLASCFPGVVADFLLKILHTNDVHARIEEANAFGGPCTSKASSAGKCFGGMARIKTMVARKKADSPENTILLDAGDQFQGTLWYYVHGGLISAKFMNRIGYDAMAIGNHEFDMGVDGLVPFVDEITFPLLSSNSNFDRTPSLRGKVKKSTIITVAGEKIGVVGYTTPETAYLSKPQTVSFTDELQAVQTQVDQMKSQGINKIIAVGHSGYSMDMYLAEKLRNVDVVVGGHTNTFLYKGTPPSNEKAEGLYPTVKTNPDGKKVLVVQEYAFGKYLGDLDVRFDDSGEILRWSGNPILLDNSVQKDPDILQIVHEHKPLIEAMKSEVVGESFVDLSSAKVTCRTKECILGNLVTDAFLDQNMRRSDRNNSWTDCAIAFVNAGSFREPIDVGPITAEEVIFAQPFRNTVDLITLSGESLKKVFEFSGSKYTTDPKVEPFGGFLQVSGLKIVYDMTQPVNSRVISIMTLCTKCLVPTYEPLDLKKRYSILTSAYLIQGGDGYKVLKESVIDRKLLGKLDTDILLNYVKKTSTLKPKLEGRIQHLGELYDTICLAANLKPAFYPTFFLVTLVVKYLFFL